MVSHGWSDLVNLNMDSNTEPNLGVGCREVKTSGFKKAMNLVLDLGSSFSWYIGICMCSGSHQRSRTTKSDVG